MSGAVLLPDIGEKEGNITIAYWHYKENDIVYKDKDLFEVCTDKAAITIPCPFTGLLTKIIFKEGDPVRVGDTVAFIKKMPL